MGRDIMKSIEVKNGCIVICEKIKFDLEDAKKLRDQLDDAIDELALIEEGGE